MLFYPFLGTFNVLWTVVPVLARITAATGFLKLTNLCKWPHTNCGVLLKKAVGFSRATTEGTAAVLPCALKPEYLMFSGEGVSAEEPRRFPWESHSRDGGYFSKRKTQAVLLALFFFFFRTNGIFKGCWVLQRTLEGPTEKQGSVSPAHSWRSASFRK